MNKKLDAQKAQICIDTAFAPIPSLAGGARENGHVWID
jgi:hypothetical protein